MILFHIHGGGFRIGSAVQARSAAGLLSLRTRARAVEPEYRHAPEHPFPAGLDDCARAYAAVRAAFPDARVTQSSRTPYSPTVIGQLLKQPSVRRSTEQSGASAALSELGVRPAADTGAAPGLLVTRRTLDRGALYHQHNPTSDTVTGEVVLDGKGRPHRLRCGEVVRISSSNRFA